MSDWFEFVPKEDIIDMFRRNTCCPLCPPDVFEDHFDKFPENELEDEKVLI